MGSVWSGTVGSSSLLPGGLPFGGGGGFGGLLVGLVVWSGVCFCSPWVLGGSTGVWWFSLGLCGFGPSWRWCVWRWGLCVCLRGVWAVGFVVWSCGAPVLCVCCVGVWAGRSGAWWRSSVALSGACWRPGL